MLRLHNFSAGPSAIPLAVLEQIKQGFIDYQGKGFSIIEISHRSTFVVDLMRGLVSRLRELTGVPETHDILFMAGGATTQYALLPMNLSMNLSNKTTGAYVDSGHWAQKAIDIAKELDNSYPKIVASGKHSNYRQIPKIQLDHEYDYLHVVSNNTIVGTQMHTYPNTNITPLAIDMTSDFLSRAIDWSNISMAYASTQKNSGCAGLTIVMINKNLYHRSRKQKNLPRIWSYAQIAKAESLLNTPPVFQIYLCSCIVEWLHEMGGLEVMHKLNNKKAQLIYNYLDEHADFYKPFSAVANRSMMNITWFLPTKELEEEFIELAQQQNMIGIKGHKAFGGLRASIYNGVPYDSCIALVNFMKYFYEKHHSR